VIWDLGTFGTLVIDKNIYDNIYYYFMVFFHFFFQEILNISYYF